MNMKNVTKTGLNDFITAKVGKNKKEVNTEIETMINSALGQAIDNYVSCEKVEKAGQVLADEMTNAISKYKTILTGWKYTEIVQDCNRYATVLGQRVRDEIIKIANENIRNPQKGSFDLGNKELNDTVIMLQKQVAPLYKKLVDLERLKIELERVIKNEPTGGRGYKALVALGVNMEGFEATSDNLPAIVKLSVDVCMLNGDCGEKVTA